MVYELYDAWVLYYMSIRDVCGTYMIKLITKEDAVRKLTIQDNVNIITFY